MKEDWHGEYEDLFAKNDFKIGQVLRIRLPNDYMVIAKPKMLIEKALPTLSAKEVAIIGTAAVVANNPKVTRRFWSWFK